MFSSYRNISLAAAWVLLVSASPAAAISTATFPTATAGNWTDPTKWTSNPYYANNGQNGDTWNAVINGTANVTLDANITIEALDFNAGTIQNSGFMLTTNQLVDWGPGANAFLTGTGTLNAIGGVAFRSNGGTNPASRNSWVINLHANSDFISGNGWNFENTGTINILPGVTFNHVGQVSGGGNIQGNTGTINNEGIYQRSTINNLVTISGQFNNKLTGQVDVLTGSLTLGNGGTQDGDFSIASGSTLSLNGTHTVNSTVSISGGGNLSVGNATFNDGSNVNVGGNVTIATIPNFNSSTPTLVGGNLLLFGSGNGFGGTGDITVTGKFDWNAPGGNALNGSGKLTILGGFEAFNSNGGDVNNKTIDIHGTSFLNSNNGWTFTNNGIFNIKSGSFDYRSQTNATSAALLGTGTINNEGLFFRSVTGLTGVINNTFNNIGGTLRGDIATTLSFNGPYNQSAGTTLINGGNLIIAGTANFNGGSIEGGAGGTLVATVNAMGAGTGLTISPGMSSIGTLSITGSVSLNANDTIAIELASGSSYDVLNVSGTVDLGNSQLQLTLLDGFNADELDELVILSAGTLNGTFANAPAGTLSIGKYKYQISYLGNQVTLSNFAQIPEPSSLMLLGCGILALARRRK